MKKTITTLSISLLLALSAQADTTISENHVVLEGGEDLTDKLVIDGAGTMSGDELYLMNATSEVTVIDVNQDYTFSNKVLVRASGSSDVWAKVDVAAGKTVKFSDFNTFQGSGELAEGMIMEGRAGLKFVSTKTSDQSQYGNVWLNSSDTNVFQKKSTQASNKNYEVWLNYVNFHSEVSAATKYHYVHMQFGANVICENDIYFETMAVREPYQKSATYSASNAFAGSLQMNGKNATIEQLTYNPGYLTKGSTDPDTGNEIVSERTFAYVDFLIDFGENDVAQVLKIGKIDQSNNFNSWDLDQLIITNFGVDDQILIGQDLTTDANKKIFDIITINGLDMSQIDVKDMGNGYWSYSVAVVPEPSTYALIFGALALGFVAYRRRK